MVEASTAGFVIDASAVLALVQREPGAEVVQGALDGGWISTVNFAEVLRKSAEAGRPPWAVGALLGSTRLAVEPFTEADALWVGATALEGRSLGLSLADRACLALASRAGRTVLTADRAMAGAELGVTVELIR